ncbi:MAG TPA: hypothetical protein VF149_04320 [Bacillales bacterium]
MNILMGLLLIILVLGTTGYHGYFVWQRKNYKTLWVQVGIAGISIIAGILIIYGGPDPSISRLLNLLSPLQK